MLLKLDRVGKSYRRAGDQPVTALNDVSLELDRGQFLAIRGPSGCGKSTLLLTVGTLLAPDQGEVELAGERPYDMRVDARAGFRSHTVGFVFQQFHLIPYLSVIDNVLAPMLALRNGQAEVDANTARGRAEQLLIRFGLQDRISHTPARLSSGERQRCALARALFNQPKLVLADEPTGNLDPDNARLVLDALREFVTQGGSVLLVTHDEQAAAAADKTVWMNQGRLGELQTVQT